MVRIFPHSAVFSPNAGKYGPEKTPYLDTFHAVYLISFDPSFGHRVNQESIYLAYLSFHTLKLDKHINDQCSPSY